MTTIIKILHIVSKRLPHFFLFLYCNSINSFFFFLYLMRQNTNGIIMRTILPKICIITENMLTGAERSKTLWALNDQLAAFSRKLHLLYLSIRYYTLNDMWNNVTAGMLDRDNGEVARMALSHWRRAAALAR